MASPKKRRQGQKFASSLDQITWGRRKKDNIFVNLKMICNLSHSDPNGVAIVVYNSKVVMRMCNYVKPMKVNRNKNVNEEDLKLIFSNLNVLEKNFIKESKLFLSVGGEDGKGSIHTMDLFISGIVNRAISLIHGFVLLANDNNYISAVPLIRIQLDNCLRFYASTLVTDYNEFFLKYLGGEHIGNLKDAAGKRMTDSYLAKQLVHQELNT